MPIPTAATIGKIQVILKQHNVVEVETGFAIHHRRVCPRMAAAPSRRMTAGPCVLKLVAGLGHGYPSVLGLEAMRAIAKWRRPSHFDVITRLCADVSFCASEPAARLAASIRDRDPPDSLLRSTGNRQETGFPLPPMPPQRVVFLVLFAVLP